MKKTTSQTEPKKQNKKIKTFEHLTSFYEAILNNANYAMISTDEVGVITLFNPAAEYMLGYSAAELVGKHTPAIFHDPIQIKLRAKQLTKEFNQTIKPGFDVFVKKTKLGLPNQQEWTYVRKDGSRLTVMLAITALYNKNKDIIGFLGIAYDVTAKNQTDRELQNAREDLSVAIELSQLGVWSWDVFSNKLYWNDKMFAIYDYPLSLRDGGLNYDHWRKRLHPEDREKTEEALHRAVQGVEDYNRTFRIILPNKSIRYIHGSAKVERNAEGVALSVTGMNLDVTMQYEYQHLLQLDKETADTANQAKSRFLANMSHEIRTPMNALIGLIQLLRKTELDVYQLDYVNKMQSSGESLLSILNDILDFSKIESNKLVLDPQPINIEVILHNLAPILAVNLGDRGLELIFDLAPDLPEYIIADGLRLQQILLNLASNAIKFTLHGEVLVSVQLIEKKPKFVTLKFSVRDTGIGISEEQLEEIFNSFSQGENSITRRFGGTGLGLAISKKLVELMGGKLCVDSTLQVGSNFYFQIQCKISRCIDCKSLYQKDNTLFLKCLVVDDNLTVRSVIVNALRSFGWIAEEASSGFDAIDKIITCDAQDPFDLVYLDYRMPKLDGWETSQRIRSLHLKSQPALVILTSLYDNNLMKHYQQDTPNILDGVLTKPITPSMLFDVAATIFMSTNHQHPKQVPLLKRLSGLRILLVEDNLTNQVVAHDLLTIEGADVDVEGNPYAVMEKIQQSLIQFDVILMDIQMPGMDGYTLTQSIRKKYPSSLLPIIAMSANTSGDDREKALTVGMNEYVCKPFNLDHLVDVLLQVTHKKQVSSSSIDVTTALSRFGENKSVYEKALAAFIVDIEQQLPQLPLTLDYDNKLVASILHTLKGLSGTMGANDLASIASEMHELFIKKRFTNKRWNFMLDFLKKTASEAIVSAKCFLDKTKKDVAPVDTSVKHVKELYTMLIAELDDHNMKSLDIYNQLLQCTQRDDVLENAIEQLDFAAAALRCRELKKDL